MILLSACLAGVPCKYSGGHNCHDYWKQYAEQGQAMLVCPETIAGLSVPRPPVELIGGDGNAVLAGVARACDRTGRDVTQAFLQGAQEILAIAQKHGISQAVLKERSPSCGSSMIYDGTFSGKIRPGMGVTTALLRQNGIEVHSEETYEK